MATMLDPQVDAVRLMADATAEWIATLGGSPQGTPGSLVAQRSWDDYSVGRADAMAHLGALDLVYAGVIEGHRAGIDTTEEPDPVTEDMLIGQSAELELFHWFVRAHLENSGASSPPAARPTRRRLRARPASGAEAGHTARSKSRCRSAS